MPPSRDPSGLLQPLNIPVLLRQYNLRPSKGLGQNFLIDPAALQRVTAAAEIAASDTVLEIGAGLGSLTRHLAAAARHVIAIELDDRLFPALQAVLAASSNVTIIHGDILQLDIAALVNMPGYLVVANIPYYITSALIRHLLEAKIKPSRLILTVQREVAERICAAPDKMSLLALSVQVYGKPAIVSQIPAGAFHPAPKVDSSVVRVDLYPQPLIDPAQLKDFFRLAKAGFSQRRKTLRNALAAGMRLKPPQAADLLQQAGIEPNRRAETLHLAEWAALTAACAE
ncbi:MAG: 16S rRNA (adenine(1518)-N(6)/adenine(1519)-N(6))-dimethyltransferase RsmA [Anaerolineaceae bacterium]|nr:16S rRNA (adenine(1518)-N(6)/adenine(1519)-N(6))-dimethyltransferase RsmA [Anaerolineaceae bacterium]